MQRIVPFIVFRALGSLIAALLTAALVPAHAGSEEAAGRVIGVVLDRQGAPVEGANVTIPALRRGMATDTKGGFVLEPVPAGRYELRAQHITFGETRGNVVVPAGSAVRVELRFGETPVYEIPVYEVLGNKPDLERTASVYSLPSGDLRQLPVGSFIEAIALKPGIVLTNEQIHVRGSRDDEIKVLIGGIAVTDPLSERNADVPVFAVASANVLTGGFDAEYGNALSGVIDVTTREGREVFEGDLRWDTDRFGDPTKTFDRYDRLTVAAGGPSAVRNLTWFGTCQGAWTDTYLRSGVTRSRRTMLDFLSLGDRQSNHLRSSLKLAWKPGAAHKLTLEQIANRTLDTPYNHMWSRSGWVQVTRDTLRTAGRPDAYVPKYGRWSETPLDGTYRPINLADHVPTLDDRFRQVTGAWIWQLSDSRVWTTRLSEVEFDAHSAVGRKQPWDYDVQSPFYWSGNTGAGTEDNLFFATHGDYPLWFHRRSNTWTLRSDLASQREDRHALKSGLELRYNRIRNLSLTLPNSESNGLPGGTRSDFLNYNPEGGAYLQDRWRFEGLVLNAGMRCDVFSPGDQIDRSDLPSGHRWKRQLSPRLGIAYPISDRDALSFHYGWTYQTPAREYVFENRGITSAVNVRGNPDLEPETNVDYQAAVQHLFSKDVYGQFAVFFRDIFGLITSRRESDRFGNLVSVYRNGDYASARGFEASVVKQFSHRFSTEINYTLSIATGVASDPNQALQFANGGRLYLPISERALNWDQRHGLNLRATVRDSSRWGMHVLWEYGSGFPFTPAFRNDRRPDPVLENSRRLPATTRLTLDADRYARIWGRDVTLFVQARNLLDAQNVRIIAANEGGFPNPYIDQNPAGDDYTIYFSETGRAGGAYLQDKNGDGVPDWVPVHDPRVLEEGRSVRIGMSVAL